jgi:hypothetical protein
MVTSLSSCEAVEESSCPCVGHSKYDHGPVGMMPRSVDLTAARLSQAVIWPHHGGGSRVELDEGRRFAMAVHPVWKLTLFKLTAAEHCQGVKG